MSYAGFGRVLVLVLTVLSLPNPSLSAQTSSCSATELEVNVILRNGKNVQGLTAQNLTGQTKHDSVEIDSLTFDSSPRRILLVLDMDRRLTPDARRAQLEIASYIVNGGREVDSFGLLTAHAQLRKPGFDQSREALLAALTELQDKKATPSSDQGILDAVLEGTSWFQKPQPGDAIIVMASEIEQNKTAQFSQVVNALSRNRIRLFSIAFGPIVGGTWWGPVPPFTHSGGWVFAENRENLSALTWNSGGYMLFEANSDPWKEYKLSDTHLKELLEEAARMYVAIATFYRISVRVPTGLKHREPWKLDLTDEIRKKVPYAYVVYPRFLEPCVAVAQGNGQ